MTLHETLNHLLGLVLPTTYEDPFRLTESEWLDIVYFAGRIGWDQSIDPDGTTSSLHAAGHATQIVWCRETRRPYYVHLVGPDYKHIPKWIDNLEQLMRKVLELKA